MRSFLFSSTVVAILSVVRVVQSEPAVFAHYMVGTIDQDHAQTDIDDAIAMSLDGFALNVGDPTQSYVQTTLEYLFNYAATKGFKLFISMDVSAAGAAGKDLGDYYNTLAYFLGATAYYKGPNGWPFLSTFSSGGYTNTAWTDFKNTYVNELYFVPDFDDTAGYYTADPGWWSYWGGVVDGLFSWESAWPNVGATNTGDVSLDNTVIAGAKAHGKTYMIALSTLQYKDSYGTDLYREGSLNLPKRIKNILGMPTRPDYVEIITWNDAGESHYIGNIWPEADNNPAVEKYATQSGWPHAAWRPLITSFIHAYRGGGSVGTMRPASNQGNAIGAMWYKDILQSSVCSGDTKPAGFDQGTDDINWMVVVATGVTGYKIRITSNGVVLTTENVNTGLNYGSIGGVRAGAQVMQLLNSAGTVVMTASGGKYVSSGCPDGVYNMNYQVVGF